MVPANITFKGMKDGLVIILNEEQSFEDLLSELEKKLESSVNFLKGVNYPVKIKGRGLSEEEFDLISKKVKEIVGLNLSKDEGDEDTDAGKRVKQKKSISQTELRGYFYGIDEGMTKFHKGTLRSGQLVKYHGNVVVIGDANPGSQIVASGTIVVLGTARGILHAGATGNKDAVVVAFSLQPTQLRIADIITRPPEEKVSKAVMPEIAFVKDETIYIEYYLPNK